MRNSKLKHALFKIFTIGILTVPSILFAEPQILVQDNEISYEMIPNNPEPYEQVSVKLTSYATDLDKAVISWQNSTSGVVLSGIGKTYLTFNAPGPDEVVYFDIVINPIGQSSTIRKRIVLNPSDIDLIWESVDGYVPPFYKGKSLPSIGGVIKVVAIPNSATITSGIGSIDYTWKNSDKTMESISGYNKNSYIFKNSLFDDINNIEVQASSVSGNFNATKRIEIPTYNPYLVFYKKSPTDGVLYNNGIVDEYDMTEDQITFVAAPYNLAISGNEKSFNYTWSVNGETVYTPKKNEITIRPTSRGGYAEIGLGIENLRELFQKVTNVFSINL